MRSVGAVLVLGMALAAGAAFAQEALPSEGAAAPVFRLPVYNPQPVGAPFVGIDRYVGAAPQEPGARLVLLGFMASYCAPCQRELPQLQALHERYGARGLRVLLVSIDAEAEGQKKVAALIAQHRVTFPVLKDRFNVVARRWLGAQSPLPSLFLVRPDGTVARVLRGYDARTLEALLGEVGSALGVPAAATARDGVR